MKVIYQVPQEEMRREFVRACGAEGAHMGRACFERS